MLFVSLSGSHRVRSWPWTGSETRLIELFEMHKCCICVPSKRIASTALKLWAVTLHRNLKVRSDSRDTWRPHIKICRWTTAGLGSCAELVVLNVFAGPPFPPESFDRVLLDAPCSGLGQRPNMGSTWSLKEICSYQPLQRKLFHAVGFYHTQIKSTLRLFFSHHIDSNSSWPKDGSIVQFLYWCVSSHRKGKIFFPPFFFANLLKGLYKTQPTETKFWFKHNNVFYNFTLKWV